MPFILLPLWCMEIQKWCPWLGTAAACRVSFHSSCTWRCSLGLQLSWSAVTFAPLDSFPCGVVSSELLQKFCPLIASGFASARVRCQLLSSVPDRTCRYNCMCWDRCLSSGLSPLRRKWFRILLKKWLALVGNHGLQLTICHVSAVKIDLYAKVLYK